MRWAATRPARARLSNRVHSFFVETAARAEQPATEAGIELKLVTPAELAGLIRAGEFVLQLHIGAILLAGLRRAYRPRRVPMAGPEPGRPSPECPAELRNRHV